MKIILDTNFLVYAAKQKIDYTSELSGKLVVLSSVVGELKKLKENARKKEDKDSAGLALQILNKNIKSKKIKVIKTKENADKAIRKLAKKEDIVATLDRGLKKKLKGKARILSIRQRKKLEIL
jgi:rRNA-processing protein FCF1